MSRQKPGEAGASEGILSATEEASASPSRGASGRWSAKRKVAVVLELLRGSDLKSLSRRHGVTAAKISACRDEFLAGGEAELKRRWGAIESEETRRLKSVVAELATDKELKESALTLRADVLDAIGAEIDPDDSRFGVDISFGVLGFANNNTGIRGDVRYFAGFQEELGDAIESPEELVGSQVLSDLNFWRANVGVAFRW